MSADKVFAKVEPSVWVVAATSSSSNIGATGSAVVIGNETLVTNCHVVRGMNRIRVHRDKIVLDAFLQYLDAQRDLCQLHVPKLVSPAASIVRVSGLVVGQRVYAVGAPQRFEASLSDGLISSLRRDATGKIEFIQTTAPISSGSSGGGLFDEEGGLIGITSEVVVARARGGIEAGVAQNLNFARPAEQIFDLPQRHRADIAGYPDVSPMQPSTVESSPRFAAPNPTAPTTQDGAETARKNPASIIRLTEDMINHREWTYPHRDTSRFGKVVLQFSDGKVFARNARSSTSGTYAIDKNRLCMEFQSWSRQCVWILEDENVMKLANSSGLKQPLVIR